jgi:histidyl-tRNA synthetase
MFAEQRDAATCLASRLRAEGEKVDLMLTSLKPKQFFARASAGTSADAIFIGPDDVAKRTARRKNLDSRTETEIALPDAP